MFKIRLMVFLVISAVLAAGILAVQGPALAREVSSPASKCDIAFMKCMDPCGYYGAICEDYCATRYGDCLRKAGVPGVPRASSPGVTGRGPIKPVVGPINPPGIDGGTTTNGKPTINLGQVGGRQQVQEGSSSPSTPEGTIFKRSGKH